MRGFNDFNEFNNEFNCESFVSVPMRGFNDFNQELKSKYAQEERVSVPMRGFNDFNPLK